MYTLVPFFSFPLSLFRDIGILIPRFACLLLIIIYRSSLCLVRFFTAIRIKDAFFLFSLLLATYLDRLYYLSYLLFFIFNLSYYTIITHLASSDAKRFDKYYRQIISPSIRPSSTDNLELGRLEPDRINWNLAWVNRYLGIDALFLRGKKHTNSYRNELTNLTKCG